MHKKSSWLILVADFGILNSVLQQTNKEKKRSAEILQTLSN
jgi:hypothetical protein